MKRLKNKIKELHPGYQFKFSTSVTVGVILVVMLTFGVVWLFNDKFGISFGMSIGFRLLIFSVVFAVIIAMLLNDKFIKPLVVLAEAMRRVTKGDYGEQLEVKHNISDIAEVYESFNLMSRALVEAETLQTDFISNVSHEFKTPINAIEGYAVLLQDTELPREQQAQYVEKIIFNTRRLSDLVGNILLLNKVNSGTFRPKANTYSLDEQIRQSILALERKWTEKDIELDVEMDEVEYCGYEVFMQHVWTNLIDNAIKFNSYGGGIRILLKKQAERVVFTISDTGAGIAPEDINRIFNKFYQGDSSHQSEGNGLGLALVYRIVTWSGGTITVDSTEGEGTTFVVDLPLSVEPEASE